MFLAGRQRAGLALGAAAVLPVLAFAVFLMSLGLGPLPNSIQAKATLGDELSLPMALVARFAGNVTAPSGAALALLGVAALVAAGTAAGRRDARALIAAGGAAVALAHLLFGKLGYIGLTALYLNNISGRGQWGPRVVHLQQVQMARFVQEQLGGPVAVNDIGRVAWQNDARVLDLWGLASAEALALRQSRPPRGWAGPLVAEAGIDVAMIYDTWLGNAVPSGWSRVARLMFDGPAGYAGGLEVSIYATRPETANTLREELTAFAPSLPPGSRLVFEAAGPEALPPGAADDNRSGG